MTITRNLVSDDWTIDRRTGNIRYIGDDHDEASPSYATVLEFHRWLQDLADGARGELDISDPNPSQRLTDNIITLINGYNIDGSAAEHLYNGSITQDNGKTIYSSVYDFLTEDEDDGMITNPFTGRKSWL